MTAFSTVTPTPTQPDPSKHVNFTLGMVLGVDDFGQEFAYHAGRDKWLARDLFGAGTIRGLGVSISSDLTEVVVAPGVALTPQGELVRVQAAQCAVLMDWLKANSTAAAAALGGPTTGTLNLYVVLRYKTCLTDPVPIPGEPCRVEADAMAPSRITDTFQLDLLLQPPTPTEEPGIRALLAWLAAVPVVPGAGTATPTAPQPLITALLNTFGPTSPLVSSSGAYPPPPAGLSFGTGTVGTMYRIALQFYVTDLRDDIADSVLGASPGAVPSDAVPTETGILLGVVHVPVSEVSTPTQGVVWTVTSAPTVDPTPTRPYLLSLDFLKEAWLAAAGGAPGIVGGAGLAATNYRTVTAGMVAIKNATTDPDPAGIDPPFVPGLQAITNKTTIGDVNVTFPDTGAPPNTRYVVKVVPIAAAAPWPVVTLKSTGPAGFVVHIAFNNGTEPTLAQLVTMRLMVEVNAFVR